MAISFPTVNQYWSPLRPPASQRWPRGLPRSRWRKESPRGPFLPWPQWERREPLEAAISFVNAGAVVTAASGSMTLGVPIGVNNGDVVLAGFHARGGTGVTITPPAGWTLVKRQDNGTVTSTVVYRAIVPIGSTTFTITGNAKTVGFTLGYSGVDNTTPMDVAPVGSNSGTAFTNATSNTVTT